MKHIIAVDFDGTCVRHEYPEIGAEVEGCADVLRALAANNVRLILWTMRSGETLAHAVAWFTAREIPLFGVNENPEQASWTGSPKAYAQLYIDDAALGCPLQHPINGARPFVDWARVHEYLTQNGWLPS